MIKYGLSLSLHIHQIKVLEIGIILLIIFSESLKMQIRNTDNEVSYEISSPDVMNEILHAVKTIICEKVCNILC